MYVYAKHLLSTHDSLPSVINTFGMEGHALASMKPARPAQPAHENRTEKLIRKISKNVCAGGVKHNTKLQLVDFVKSKYKPDYWIEAQIKSPLLLRTLPFLRRHTDVMTRHRMRSHQKNIKECVRWW